MLNEITIQKKGYLTKMALASLKRTAYEYVNLSQICHEYHQEFGYQDYTAWVKNDLGLGSRRGDQLLNVYDRFGVTAVTAVENLPAEIMVLLAAPSVPESARIEAIEKVENGIIENKNGDIVRISVELGPEAEKYVKKTVVITLR